MKRVLLVIILFCALNALAGDTLTRAQVYNFSVGDTFDYSNYQWSQVLNWNTGTWQNTNTTYYSRCIINSIYYQPDSTTKLIVRRWVFPAPSHNDTLTLVNLTGYELYLDTSTVPCQGRTIFLDSSSRYNGRMVDSMTEYECQGPNTTYITCAAGLGSVLSAYEQGAQNQFGGFATTLIYYAKGNETWGTPYYDFPTAIQQLKATNSQIALLPSVNDGNFNVKISDAALLPVNLTIYDITGRQIKQLTLNNLNNNINIQPAAAGTYIWKAMQQGQLLQTGKLVVY